MKAERFIESLRPYLSDVEKFDEIPRAQRLLDRPLLSVILANEALKEKETRDAAICQAYAEFGFSMAAIGRHTNLHYSTVSRIVRGER